MRTVLGVALLAGGVLTGIFETILGGVVIGVFGLWLLLAGDSPPPDDIQGNPGPPFSP